MSYLLLIAEPVGQRATRTQAEGEAAYAQMRAFADELQRQGKLRAVESLTGLDQARRVQVRDGVARQIDGPFSEAKEMIGGFFLLQDVDEPQALAIAARCPAAAWATVEVRRLGPCFL